MDLQEDKAPQMASWHWSLAIQMLKEHDKDVYILFLDLVKAFNMVNRDMLLQILHKYVVPEDMMSNVIKKLYTIIFIEFKLDSEKSIKLNEEEDQNGCDQKLDTQPPLLVWF